jgi:MFS transporter, DHA2 family, multidrug resistance protein
MDNWNGLPRPRLYWSVATIWLALSMSVLDATIANVALPAIARDLHAAAAESIWVVNAYQLAILVTVLPLAALGEVVEFRRVFQGGLILFVLASIGCAFARTLPELAVARAVQGLGAAGIMSVNGALVRFTYPHAQLGRGVGLNALVVSVASVIGPSLASAILAVGSWQWLFAINVPIGLVALLTARSLPSSPRSGTSLDWTAAGLNVLTFGLIVVGIDVLTRGGVPLAGVLELTGGLLAGALLVRRSLSQARPLAPFDLLRSRPFTLTVLTSIASFTAQMLAFVALPFHMQGALHLNQVQTGLLITPWPLAVGVAAPIAGRLADRYPAAILGGIGLAALALGLALLATAPVHAGMIGVAWRMALCGLGFGFFQAPNNRTMLSSAPLARSGAAGGMLATARLTGQTAGATLTAILFRMSGGGPLLALAAGAAFAAAASIVSFSRLVDAPSPTALAVNGGRKT